jgi:mono/diheme cytochrome c family protein
MTARTLTSALPIALAVLITAAGCAKKETEAPAQTAAPPEAAASAAPAPSAEPAPATTPAPEAAPAAAATPAASTAPAPAAAPAAAVTAAAGNAAGAKVFKMYCETCHGPGGKGDGPAAAALNPKPANFAAGAFKYDANGNGKKGDIDDIKAIAHDGAAKHGGSPLMAPWTMLSPDQLQAVAEYVKSLHTG